MARAMNWGGAASRARARRHGTEDLGGSVNGAQARKEAVDAEMVTRVLRCACGHRGKVELPAAMLAGRKFRCRACSKVMS
ncbi:hypothetical protein [Hoeflea ulvae]|uniref:Uncharacterized protein n=1 Tax=Hoeflea ulvae TaxID=2983764 RepID=A0ABT3YFF7_9HYPH|nr:hypothetical protein [Hoeflea ulvae]MCY0094609.1 hypothetical protein [Hoeflea ulvae]